MLSSPRKLGWLMRRQNNIINSNSFIKIQEEKDFENYRYAGKITAGCLSLLEKEVINGTGKTLKQLDLIAEEFFLDNKTKPVFKGYHGFPASVCISIDNKAIHQLIHSIPTDYVPQEGDLISFDTGCNFNGAISDSALTTAINDTTMANYRLMDTGRRCLYEGMKQIRKGNKTGAIGNAIFHTARKQEYKVIEEYTGHGISLNQVHSDPPIFNKSDPSSGIEFISGMVFAIEPLLVRGDSTKTKIDRDGWTIVSENVSCHYEHSILINGDKVEVLTRREGEEINAIQSFV